MHLPYRAFLVGHLKIVREKNSDAGMKNVKLKGSHFEIRAYTRTPESERLYSNNSTENGTLFLITLLKMEPYDSQSRGKM